MTFSLCKYWSSFHWRIWRINSFRVSNLLYWQIK